MGHEVGHAAEEWQEADMLKQHVAALLQARAGDACVMFQGAPAICLESCPLAPMSAASP